MVFESFISPFKIFLPLISVIVYVFMPFTGIFTYSKSFTGFGAILRFNFEFFISLVERFPV